MNRLRLLRLGFFAVGLVIIGQLFRIEVLAHDFYSALAEGQHDLFQQLFPERGKIYARDHQSGDQTFLLATNRTLNLLYAEPFRIKNPVMEAKALAPLINADPTELAAKLSSPTDRYRVLAHKVDDDTRAKIEALTLEGIGFSDEDFRFYPESDAGAQMLGFVAQDAKGMIGHYGIEGWFNQELSGTQGYLQSEKDSSGRLIGVGNRTLQPAKDGDDLVLTIDRTVQYVACKKLNEWVAKFSAEKGSLVILDPKTGAVIAMCNAPTFDPNAYSKIDAVDVYNNTAIFTPYEPGSVFKTITMAAGIDTGKITPDSTFDDPGEVKIGPFTIRNADLKAHGVVSMTYVLAQSLNTGIDFVVGKIGAPTFLSYARDFGFGQKTGITLESESPGDISQLERKGDIWSATAAFGQGVSATVLQLASAYGAIANGGILMKPYIVDEIRPALGAPQVMTPKIVRRVITEKTARLLTGMLVAVVESGEGHRANVPGYWIGGKTGTAQIPRTDGGGYEVGPTIGSFVGFGPVDDPRFVMVVRIDRPQGVQYAESSAAPLWGDVAKFLMDYYQIPPTRK